MTDTTATRSSTAIPIDGRYPYRRVSWSALLGGVVLALSVQLLLSLLGAGIGLGTVNVAAGSTPNASSFGFGAGLWWVISSCVALFAGGFASAWLAGNEVKFDAMLQGLVTWGITTLVTVYLLTSAVGGLIGGGFSAIGSTASTLGSGVKDAAGKAADAAGISPDMIKEQASAYLKPVNADPAKMSAPDAQKDVAFNLVTYGQGGPGAEAAKARIIDVTAGQLNISHEDAVKKFDDAQAKIKQTLAQAKQKAANAADATASAGAKTAFAVFVDLLLGAIAAAFGGSLAIDPRYRRPVVART